VNEAELWAIIAFTILVSTVVHGFTAAFAVERATGEKQTDSEGEAEVAPDRA
jgi:NhaP-type Na+/H+ or K+/H+ antiporter